MTRRLLLVTGIPATGKTTIGEYLRATHGFLHVNREIHQPPSFSDDPKAFLASCTDDVVATWGFRPAEHDDLDAVRQLVHLGFRGVWFDGYRPWALAHLIDARPEQEWEFYLQMFNIERSGIAAQLAFPKINPFTATGTFREKADIAKDLLAFLR